MFVAVAFLIKDYQSDCRLLSVIGVSLVDWRVEIKVALLLKMWLLFIMVCKIGKCLFICLMIKSFEDVDCDVPTAIPTSLHLVCEQALWFRS